MRISIKRNILFYWVFITAVTYVFPCSALEFTEIQKKNAEKYVAAIRNNDLNTARKLIKDGFIFKDMPGTWRDAVVFIAFRSKNDKVINHLLFEIDQLPPGSAILNYGFYIDDKELIEKCIKYGTKLDHSYDGYVRWKISSKMQCEFCKPFTTDWLKIKEIYDWNCILTEIKNDVKELELIEKNARSDRYAWQKKESTRQIEKKKKDLEKHCSLFFQNSVRVLFPTVARINNQTQRRPMPIILNCKEKFHEKFHVGQNYDFDLFHPDVYENWWKNIYESLDVIFACPEARKTMQHFAKIAVDAKEEEIKECKRLIKIQPHDMYVGQAELALKSEYVNRFMGCLRALASGKDKHWLGKKHFSQIPTEYPQVYKEYKQSRFERAQALAKAKEKNLDITYVLKNLRKSHDEIIKQNQRIEETASKEQEKLQKQINEYFEKQKSSIEHDDSKEKIVYWTEKDWNPYSFLEKKEEQKRKGKSKSISLFMPNIYSDAAKNRQRWDIGPISESTPDIIRISTGKYWHEGFEDYDLAQMRLLSVKVKIGSSRSWLPKLEFGKRRGDFLLFMSPFSGRREDWIQIASFISPPRISHEKLISEIDSMPKGIFDLHEDSPFVKHGGGRESDQDITLDSENELIKRIDRSRLIRAYQEISAHFIAIINRILEAKDREDYAAIEKELNDFLIRSVFPQNIQACDELIELKEKFR